MSQEIVTEEEKVTSWSRVYLEKLIVTQLVEKFPDSGSQGPSY
jgi:hypothetical protein